MEIKKPQYIRKYDFVRYFIRNEDEWFWSTNQLKEYIEQKSLQLTKKEIDIDNEDEDSQDEYEFDNYEYKKENEDLNINDPKVFEGNLIDKESKKFIKSQFSMCRKIYDFDEFNLSNDESFIKTMDYLRNDDNFILFQPSFIYQSKAIAKPDALIKSNGKYILVETKGTTCVKCSHLIDLTYQHHIINECLKQVKSAISQCYLCFVDYKIADKNEIGFCLSEFASIVKSGYGTPKTKFLKYTNEWILERRKNKMAVNKSIPYLDIIDNYKNIAPVGYTKQDGTLYKDWEKFISNYKLIADYDEFNNVIDKLNKHTINFQPQLEPTNKYKCWFKDNDYWPEIKQYYINDINNDKHQLFSYSGFLVGFNKVYQDYYKLNKTTQEMFEDFKIISNASNAYYYRTKENKIINELTKERFKQLKDKKVYFDFESLNLATRVIDDTLPFMQTVNQVSIIIDNGNGVNSQTPCNNILFDPLLMDKSKYKQIVDAILPDKNNLAICENYSYIVYNKSFEKSRLEEMKWLINENDYSKKIDIIINNLNMFDLADFFDPRREEYICLSELKGFYSIKRVLPLVEKYAKDIYQNVGCKDYKNELIIHNGSEAQTLATQRFFKLIDDNKWQEISINLKKYCENDVRAMVAVEYYIKKIINTI